MKTFTFIIMDQKICSVNSAYTSADAWSRDGNPYKKQVKNTETKNWLYELKVKMLKSKDTIDLIKKMYSPYQYFLAARYYWFLPWNEFWTRDSKVKQLRINNRHGDVSNFAKIPDDLIFNDLLGIDDSQVCGETVYKLPWKGDRHLIKLCVDVIELEKLTLKSSQVLPEFLK